MQKVYEFVSIRENSWIKTWHVNCNSSPEGVEILERMFYNQYYISSSTTSSIKGENAMSKRNVVHVEIPASVVSDASKFFETLFGWKMEHAPEFDYTMWSDGSGYGGGFNKLSDEHPAGQVLVYIHSDDID